MKKLILNLFYFCCFATINICSAMEMDEEFLQLPDIFEFPTEQNIDHNEEKKFKCPLCTVSFSENDYLIQHTLSMHFITGFFKCQHENCSQKITRFHSLTSHHKGHEDINITDCVQCKELYELDKTTWHTIKQAAKKFLTNTQIEVETRNIINTQLKLIHCWSNESRKRKASCQKLDCHLCHKKIAVSNIRKHITSDIIKPFDNFTCAHCNKNTTYYQMPTHHKTHHHKSIQHCPDENCNKMKSESVIRWKELLQTNANSIATEVKKFTNSSSHEEVDVLKFIDSDN